MIEREEETEKKYPNHYERKRTLISQRTTVENSKVIFILHSSLLDHIERHRLLLFSAN